MIGGHTSLTDSLEPKLTNLLDAISSLLDKLDVVSGSVRIRVMCSLFVVVGLMDDSENAHMSRVNLALAQAADATNQIAKRFTVRELRDLSCFQRVCADARSHFGDNRDTGWYFRHEL
jgi:hypothetical protein